MVPYEAERLGKIIGVSIGVVTGLGIWIAAIYIVLHFAFKYW